ncbi:MAG: 3-oxoacyl-ACP reductase FabG [bacterium]|jgi:3-oxoacyl-[acyl-carrier protein] reductase
MPVDIDFSERVALVTGASRGIGASCARLLARAGAAVAVNYNASESAAGEVVASINADGGKGIAVRFDVADRDAVLAGVAEIAGKLGSIDLLVCNAGLRRDNLTHRMTPEEWNGGISANLGGVFNTVQACLDGMMKKRFGRIVAVSSIAGQIGSLGQSNYAAAKAGVTAFIKSVATEYAGRNIRANVVIPGIIATDMTGGLKPELAEDYIKRIPMKRFGTPDDVAGAVLFLLSELSAYVNGATLSVNGGGLMV